MSSELEKNEIIVYDFRKNWKLVEPHLDDPDVKRVINNSMKAYYRYENTHDDNGFMVLSKRPTPLEWDNTQGPWSIGNGKGNGQRVRKNKLSWYQPWGRSHWIAPFCEQIGRILYPDLRWSIRKCARYAVAVGTNPVTRYASICHFDKNICAPIGTFMQVEVVMDILHFDSWSAHQICDYANEEISNEECEVIWGPKIDPY